MKKVAIISSKEGILLESIVRYLANIKFVCISTNKNAYSLERASYLNIETKIVEHNELNEFLNSENFDFVIYEDFEKYNGVGLNIYPSILPLFETSDKPIADAIISGCKLAGVSVLYNNKIVAQYPVFITNEMHYEDLENAIVKVEQVLYPLVIEKIINNEVFEVQTIMKTSSCASKSCSGNCESCAR